MGKIYDCYVAETSSDCSKLAFLGGGLGDINETLENL